MSNPKIESLQDVLERAAQYQMGKQPALQTEPVVVPTKKMEDKLAVGQQWLRDFKESDWPTGKAEVSEDLYQCIELAARIYKTEWGLRLRWMSPHTFMFRCIPIIKKS